MKYTSRIQIINTKLNNFFKDKLFHETNKSKNLKDIAAILLILCPKINFNGEVEPHLILTKRSSSIKYPGNLCYPGGKVFPTLDLAISKIIKLPFTPLTRYFLKNNWNKKKTEKK